MWLSFRLPYSDRGGRWNKHLARSPYKTLLHIILVINPLHASRDSCQVCLSVFLYHFGECVLQSIFLALLNFSFLFLSRSESTNYRCEFWPFNMCLSMEVQPHLTCVFLQPVFAGQRAPWAIFQFKTSASRTFGFHCHKLAAESRSRAFPSSHGASTWLDATVVAASQRGDGFRWWPRSCWDDVPEGVESLTSKWPARHLWSVRVGFRHLRGRADSSDSKKSYHCAKLPRDGFWHLFVWDGNWSPFCSEVSRTNFCSWWRPCSSKCGWFACTRFFEERWERTEEGDPQWQRLSWKRRSCSGSSRPST